LLKLAVVDVIELGITSRPLDCGFTDFDAGDLFEVGGTRDREQTAATVGIDEVTIAGSIFSSV